MINLCAKEDPQVVKFVFVALNPLDHAFRQHSTLFKQLSRSSSLVCSPFSRMCQRPQADQEKPCPLSPPPGHLTTVALSVQRHTSFHGFFSSTSATPPLSEGLSRRRLTAEKVACVWVFAWPSRPCRRQGNNTRPAPKFWCSYKLFMIKKKKTSAKTLKVKTRQQDFVSKAALLHSKPYTVLGASKPSYPNIFKKLQNYRLKKSL